MLKILIVDDSRISRVMMTSSIKKYIDQELEILQAENGEIAVELYKITRPDLVLLDLTMPVMDGYEALEKIIEINSDALVYVVSSDVQKLALDKVVSLGAAGMVGKPISEDKIVQIFSELSI